PLGLLLVYNQLWLIRKDPFPAVGAVRETGTTVTIEDVTFPVERLAEGVNRLIELFDKHRYDEEDGGQEDLGR
ncbi:FAD-linked oxidase C-terminal domain-containing protein, partial [Klebsiella pneumoniae]|uniref:FAD-linked oxidase C-terminal domain-containing protein n=1 Tax=Klebsiella pneumoniae TaxID=573 RepID=UPI003967F876